VLALVALVAVAATGRTPAGTGRTRQPGNEFLDTIFSLWLVLLAIGFALLVYGLTQRRAIAEEMATRRKRRGAAFLVLLGALTVAVYLEMLRRHVHRLPFQTEGGGRTGQGQPTLPRNGALRDYHAQFAWIPVLVIVGLAVAAFVAWTLAARRRAPLPDLVQARIRETLEDVIEDTLDDLRAEADPRRAVIACYARLERALAAAGFPRRRAETQVEHLTRILGALDIRTASVRRLNELFLRAKFSPHEIDAAMKEDAIEALVDIRDELRASEERRRELEIALRPGTARS
jgi:heme exporter protein D